jgi:FkbM family methyltransferase
MNAAELFKAPLRPVREWLLRAATRGRGVRRTVNGVALRVDSRARLNFVPYYDAPVAEYLRAHVAQGCEIWNAGANVGVYALQLAAMVGDAGKVVAFEPNPLAREVLRENVRLNCLGDRVEVVDRALGEHAGTVELFIAGLDGMARLGRPNPVLGRTSAVSAVVTTLDAFAAARGSKPSWIVMDIEGWEIAALRGARSLLRQTRFIVELHPGAWQWSGHRRDELEALLDEFDLEAVGLVGQKDPLAEHGQVLLDRAACRAGT